MDPLVTLVVVRVERRVRAEQGEEDAAERKQIDLRPIRLGGVPPARLEGGNHLGRHVRNRAAHLRQRRAALASNVRCEPKVGHLHLVGAGQQQVLRLQIAMHHADGVHERERERHLAEHGRRVGLAVRPLLADAIKDLTPLRQLHHKHRRLWQLKLRRAGGDGACSARARE